MRRLLLGCACVALLLTPAAVRSDQHHHGHYHLWQSRAVRSDLALQTALFATGAALISVARLYRMQRERVGP